MILGFAFRSPDVIRHTTDRTKFATFVVPRYSDSGAHIKAYELAVASPVGNRKRVILFSDCRAFTSVSRSGKFQSTKHVYVLFDSASVLSSKSCVEILDTNTAENVPVWQYQKTLPSTLSNVFSKAAEGVTTEDLECVNALIETPESRITSDIPKREEIEPTTVTLNAAVKSIMERKVFAENTHIARAVVCMYIMGMFHESSDVTTKVRNLKYIGLQNIGTFKKEANAEAIRNMRRFCRLRHGFKIGNKTCQAIGSLTEHGGFLVSLLGLHLISKGVNVDKACADTGSDHAFLQTMRKELDQIRSNPKVSYQYQNTTLAFPLRLVKKRTIETVEADCDLKKKYQTKKRIVIRAGKYTDESLLRECGLLRPGENYTAIISGKHNHKLVTNISKFKQNKTREPMYLVRKGEKNYVRFRSIRLKVMGA